MGSQALGRVPAGEETGLWPSQHMAGSLGVPGTSCSLDSFNVRCCSKHVIPQSGGDHITERSLTYVLCTPKCQMLRPG